MKNADDTYSPIDSPVEERVFALDDFTDRQLENLRNRLPRNNSSTYRNFHYFGKDKVNFSGWKLQIPGENIAHSVYLYENLELVAIKWRAFAKVGGELPSEHTILQGYMIPPGDASYGKSGATIYVPASVFKGDYLQAFVDDILTATTEYSCKVKPSCTRHLYSHLYYRYEFRNKCDITIGIPWLHYRLLYIGSHPGTPYKPDDVADPFLTLVLPSC